MFKLNLIWEKFEKNLKPCQKMGGSLPIYLRGLNNNNNNNNNNNLKIALTYVQIWMSDLN